MTAATGGNTGVVKRGSRGISTGLQFGSGNEIIWRCLYCSDNSADDSLPAAESTRIGFEETDSASFNIPASFADSISVNQETGIAIL